MSFPIILISQAFSANCGHYKKWNEYNVSICKSIKNIVLKYHQYTKWHQYIKFLQSNKTNKQTDNIGQTYKQQSKHEYEIQRVK